MKTTEPPNLHDSLACRNHVFDLVFALKIEFAPYGLLTLSCQKLSQFIKHKVLKDCLQTLIVTFFVYWRQINFFL